jgi:CBS domain-containing protein
MSQEPLPFPVNELLPIRICRTASPAGENANWFSVYCPRRSGSVALAECVECGECEGVGTDPQTDSAYLRCRWPSHEWTDEPARGAEPVQADRVSVVAIMSGDTLCVDPELRLEALLQLFLDRGISGAPVVDKQGRPLGVVSKTDLLRNQQETGGLFELDNAVADSSDCSSKMELGFHLEQVREGKVKDIMTPVSFTLGENATVARAAALMAYEGVHRVPVISTTGRVIGLVSALDVARWVAETSGFCLRGATRPPSSQPR